MKYLVILGDGMADRPIESLGGRTPLEYAKTPKMDELAAKGEDRHGTYDPGRHEAGQRHCQSLPCWDTIRENFIRGVLRLRHSLSVFQ